MRWLLSSAASALSGIMTIWVLSEHLSIPPLSRIFINVYDIVLLYIAIFIPLSILSYMNTSYIERRIRGLEDSVRRIKNMVDAYQLVLNSMNSDINSLRKSLDEQNLPEMRRAIYSLEKRIAASEKILGAILEILLPSEKKGEG
jgi:hypothetical protein